MNFSKSIEFKLKTGDLVTIEMTDVLLESIKSTFKLDTVDAIEERHVKYYLVSSMKNALETADGRPD